ncbi:YfcE family phosphodiesterase [Virgibacillus phasianinus]|uniref:Phosphoesterase n=1 Tax=Virgibacillus phasianinus TaxID=2017483 RepID=A0A220U5C5_9BACI|nr:metallophosphoesterase [Virgibacillus phasianinus]ASK63041.1 YfcE family phosphodiesterase [Virgibacillus phasianinus]
MAKLLFVSDSHGLTSELSNIKNQVDADLLVHCGDSELELDAEQLDGFVKVRGNCDYDNRLPDEQTVEIDSLQVLVTHGHLHQVKSGLTTLSYRAEELGAQVIGFGHTHVAGAEKVGNQLFINPGSIRLPRRIKEKTYAIMEWDKLDDICVSFYTLDGDIVDELTCHTSLLEAY